MRGIRDLGRLPAMDLADRAAMNESPLIPMMGAPLVPMPEHVLEAVRAQSKLVPIRESRGTAPLRSALTEMLHRRDGVEIDPERELIVTHGAGHGMSVTLGALCGAGDEVLVPVPAYFFDGAIVRSGATPRYVPCSEADGWALDLHAIEKAINERTRVILLCNPVNPTGRLHSAAEIDDLVRIARKHGVLLVSDESFSHYCYEGPFVPVATRTAAYDRIVTVQSLSKNYAFADWRVGYVHGPADLVDAIHWCFEWDAINVGSVPQAAAVAAINGPSEWIDRLIASYPPKRDRLVRLVRDAGFSVVSPAAGAAMLVDFGRLGLAGRDLEDRLLSEGIAALSGDGFRGPADHARLLFGGDSDALLQLGESLARLGQATNPPAPRLTGANATKGLLA